MKTEVKTELVQTHHFTMTEKGDKKKALDQVDLLDLTVKYSDQHELIATKVIEPKEIHELIVQKRLYVVATVMHVGNTDFFGDVLMITKDKTQAKTLTYTVKERRPVEGLDYKKLSNFTDVIYFERETGKVTVIKEEA